MGLSLFGAYGARKGIQTNGLWINAKFLSSNGGIAGSSATSAVSRAVELSRDYSGQLKDSIVGTSLEGRITMAVGIATDANGNQFTLIGTSEPNGYIRPQISGVVSRWGYRLGTNLRVVKGGSHAEADIVAYCKAQGWNIISIGATRPVCNSCAAEMATAGATVATPLKNP